MKKIMLLSLVAFSSIFAASDKEILDFYQKVLPSGLNAKIVNRQSIDKPGFEAVTIRISNNEGSQDDILFTNENLIFPEIINIKDGKSYKSEISKKATASNLKDVYSKESKKYIINIGSDKNKITKVMFSDPECPFCRAELKKIEKTLKDENLKIILTPVHGDSSLEKSYLIYQDIKNAKSDSDKVKILRKYFAEDYNVPKGKVSKANIKEMDNLRQKYFAAGIRGVPFFIDEKDISK